VVPLLAAGRVDVVARVAAAGASTLFPMPAVGRLMAAEVMPRSCAAEAASRSSVATARSCSALEREEARVPGRLLRDARTAEVESEPRPNADAALLLEVRMPLLAAG
jgi:hypothetical protein